MVRVGYWVRVVATAVFGVLLSYVIRLKFTPIADGLDPSWIAGVSEAQSGGLQFGPDIRFTVGPYLNVLYKYYQGDFSIAVFAGSVILIAYGVLTSFKLFTKDAVYTTIFILAALMSTVFVDSILNILPLFAVYVVGRDDKPNTWYIAASATAFSIIALTKFSALPVIILASLLIDFIRLSRRQAPICSVLFLVALVLAMFLAGMQIGSLPDYMVSSLDVSASYSDSMSTPGSFKEISIWLVLAMSGATIFALDQLFRLKPFTIGKFIQVSSAPVLLFIILLLSLKHGFVRHDLHSLIAWSALILSIGGAIFVANSNVSKIALAGIVLCSIVWTHTYANFDAIGDRWSIPSIPTRLSAGLSEVGEIGRFLRNPARWADDHAEAQSSAKARIKAAKPMPLIEGTVDVIPNIQSRVIASGMQYTPRPTIQEYATYSTALIEANREFFKSTRAPRTVLFGIDPIDQRLPAFTEGALWPLFLEKYEPTDEKDGLVVLRQRAQALPELTGAFSTATGRIGEKIDLPKDDSVVFAKIEIRHTLIGRIIRLLFKTPELHIKLYYADREPEVFRFIPGIAENGFILSPVIKSVGEFVDIATGVENPVGSNRPVSFEILRPNWLGRSYVPEFKVQYAKLDTHPLAAASTANAFLKARIKETGQKVVRPQPN